MFEYQATAINVVDGDTLDVAIDLGFRIGVIQRVRLYGIDTPEVGQPGYSDAKHKLQELVIARQLIVRSVKPHDKYGRWLAQIQVPGKWPDVAEELITLGLGVRYFGGAKQ